MTEHQIKLLLDRYSQGKATEEEMRKLELWYAEQEHISDWNIDANRKENILAAGHQHLTQQLFPVRKSLATRYWMAAAASLLVFISAWLFLKSPAHREYTAEDYTVQTVGKGKMIKVTLEDGSNLTLNAGTTVKYLKKFDTDERRIQLISGEIYFDVHHETGRPFIVEAGGVTTQVLGTAFNIASYKRSEAVRVTVTRGKVSVMHVDPQNSTKASAPVILLPDDQVIVNKSSGRIEKNRVAANDVVAWIDGRLTFVSEKMSDVASILDDRFDTHITFQDDTIRKFRVSAGFEPGDKIDDILFALSKANNLSYTKNGQNIVIRLDK